MATNFNISTAFGRNAGLFPDNSALVVGADRFTYGELASLVQRLAGILAPVLTHGRVGILATRSTEACAGILTTAWAGGTYVPIGLKLPEERLIALFEMLQLDALIVDKAGERLLSDTLIAAAPRLILAPGETRGDFKALKGSLSATPGPAMPTPVKVGPSHTAYIEFTSGTTGTPKGVMVSAGAVAAYLEAMHTWYDFGPEDRAAETCDITFDLSVHNMLTTWKAGAELHIMRPLDMIAPARFVNSHRITTWLSVPSVVAMTRKTGGLSPSSMRTLRISLFCGEPLPASAARAWAEAAPNSVIDNIYGPTEATIACLRQTWSAGGRETASRAIVAIGQPYPAMQAEIVDPEGRPVEDGTAGEIALAGAQLADGYFQQPELTAARFPTREGTRWYLTGDRGYRDPDGVFHHLGRLDNQIKLHGHRIELEEIDTHLRAATATEMAVVVAWPLSHGSAEGLVGFYAAAPHDGKQIRERLALVLPPHMIPDRFEAIETMPLNANGKIDRNALFRRLEAGEVELERAS
ncbi:amino acid adenylation domain-containing protein [Pseudohoeflea coraliihabitans]|uniref:Amino acid adenylation domain-containing protein n=1 Tax=Pseudohoeflea coraliihabitans TaxID=2860393 RepID=A0ABS6WKZ3_9HYPH|nr:amino acid adenylation domain-containing protein [Pseudohoeflea sp. DP4N28-3]MBW3096550.1 amino acid adenylation domain-containing protein [Pseudohoeflea sp. DP4N28-3]